MVSITTRRFWLWTLSLTILLMLVMWKPAQWVWRHFRSYEVNEVADSYWVPGGQPYKVVFRVKDVNDQPLPNIKMRFVDNSGGTQGLTDANGEWVCHPDGELLTFSLNDVPVMEERLFGVSRDERGLILHVTVKDEARIGISRERQEHP